MIFLIWILLIASLIRIAWFISSMEKNYLEEECPSYGHGNERPKLSREHDLLRCIKLYLTTPCLNLYWKKLPHYKVLLIKYSVLFLLKWNRNIEFLNTAFLPYTIVTVFTVHHITLLVIPHEQYAMARWINEQGLIPAIAQHHQTGRW